MKYMKLYGSMGPGEHTDVDRLHRRIERYRRALRRCARRRGRETTPGRYTSTDVSARHHSCS
jgi:hypothetical protein